MVRIASATGVPWATRTSTWRSLATISSGLCLFLDMDPSSFGSEAILQGGPLQRGRITSAYRQKYGDGFLGAPLLLCRPSKMRWPDHGGAGATAQDCSSLDLIGRRVSLAQTRAEAGRGAVGVRSAQPRRFIGHRP